MAGGGRRAGGRWTRGKTSPVGRGRDGRRPAAGAARVPAAARAGQRGRSPGAVAEVADAFRREWERCPDSAGRVLYEHAVDTASPPGFVLPDALDVDGTPVRAEGVLRSGRGRGR